MSVGTGTKEVAKLMAEEVYKEAAKGQVGTKALVMERQRGAAAGMLSLCVFVTVAMGAEVLVALMHVVHRQD